MGGDAGTRDGIVLCLFLLPIAIVCSLTLEDSGQKLVKGAEELHQDVAGSCGLAL